mmetsp:Transcript_17626/g.26753  ORF Transcript_17626/g.26753 Transcript_17626/m.26753 type:complete len:281 (-) Transcript_17626:201-1043(-)
MSVLEDRSLICASFLSIFSLKSTSISSIFFSRKAIASLCCLSDKVFSSSRATNAICASLSCFLALSLPAFFDSKTRNFSRRLFSSDDDAFCSFVNTSTSSRNVWISYLFSFSSFSIPCSLLLGLFVSRRIFFSYPCSTFSSRVSNSASRSALSFAAFETISLSRFSFRESSCVCLLLNFSFWLFKDISASWSLRDKPSFSLLSSPFSFLNASKSSGKSFKEPLSLEDLIFFESSSSFETNSSSSCKSRSSSVFCKTISSFSSNSCPISSISNLRRSISSL